MLDYAELMTSFLTGATAGMGRGISRSMLRWILRKERPKIEPVVEHNQLVRSLTQEDLIAFRDNQIPKGYAVCRLEDSKWRQTYEDGLSLPRSISDNQSFWLIPNRDYRIESEFKIGNHPIYFDLGIEPEPLEGVELLVRNSHEINFQAICVTVSEILFDLGISLGVNALVQNSVETQSVCQVSLDPALKAFGLRSHHVRFTKDKPDEKIQSQNDMNLAAFESDSTERDLDQLIADSSKDDREWSSLVSEITKLLPECSSETRNRLRLMQSEILDGKATAREIADSIANLTSEGLTRAGVSPPDLQRWMLLEQSLVQTGSGTSTNITGVESSFAIGINSVRRPGTFLTWNREEVERRLTDFVKASVMQSRSTCAQAMRQTQISDLGVLRQIRDLERELLAIESLLLSTGTQRMQSRVVRLTTHQKQQQLKALEMAAVHAGELVSRLGLMFREKPNHDSWNDRLHEVKTTVTMLEQSVQLRRELP